MNWDVLVRGGVFQERPLDFECMKPMYVDQKVGTHENASGEESTSVNVSQREPKSSRG